MSERRYEMQRALVYQEVPRRHSVQVALDDIDARLTALEKRTGGVSLAQLREMEEGDTFFMKMTHRGKGRPIAHYPESELYDRALERETADNAEEVSAIPTKPSKQGANGQETSTSRSDEPNYLDGNAPTCVNGPTSPDAQAHTVSAESDGKRDVSSAEGPPTEDELHADCPAEGEAENLFHTQDDASQERERDGYDHTQIGLVEEVARAMFMGGEDESVPEDWKDDACIAILKLADWLEGNLHPYSAVCGAVKTLRAEVEK